MISEHAQIHASAQIGKDVEVGPWSIIGPNVELGDRVKIASHVVVEKNTRIGHDTIVHPFACLGADPQDITYAGEETWLEIGHHNVIREYVSLHRASTKDQGVTRIGDHNQIFAYCHVAHDCQIGNHVLLLNNATLAGHCVIDDFAMIGGMVALHQFCRVGCYSFLSRAAKVVQDVPPFLLVVYNPGRPSGLNTVGLKRAGFSLEALRQLKRAYRSLYQENRSLAEALTVLSEQAKTSSEVQLFHDFIVDSKRGIVR